MMGTIRGYIMMKRNLIALALLLIVAIAFLAVPVSAILTLSSGNDAKIITTDGEMTYTFIADPPIPTGKGIGIDVFLLSTQCIQSESGFTEKNVKITSNAAGATWGAVVEDDYLTLTKTCVGCAVPVTETIDLTFTGAENPWKSGKQIDFTYDPDLDPLSWFATRTDTLDKANFDFHINTLVPTVSSATTNAAGTVITITFRKEMADPSDKHGEFKYQINGEPDQAFSEAALKGGAPTKIDLTIPDTSTAIAPGDVVTVKYTGVDVIATDNGVLASFSGQTVTNAMPFPVPTVSNLDPTHGPETGGTKVTVTGTGFFKVTAVKFVGKAGVDLTTDSDTQITVTSPDGGSGAKALVTVITPGGTSDEKIYFTYDPAPIVEGITPNTGIKPGLVSFTITGTDFVDGATVILKGPAPADIIKATHVVWDISGKKITCDLDITGAVTDEWDFIVTNPDGQNSGTSGNNLFQMIGLAVANSVSNAPSDSSVGAAGTGGAPGAGTGQNTAPASVGNPVEPEAPGPASPATMEAVTAELSINDQGVISQSTELQSADGRASVSIDAGVVALDQAGAPVSSVSIDTLGPSDMPDVPQGGAVSFAGIAYELGPNGAQFSPAISITFAALPGQVGQDFTVRTYDQASGTWQDLPTSYDPQTGTVTAEVSHFCCLALFAKTVTTAPTAPVIAATIAATHVPTQLIPTKIAPPSPTIATTFLGIVLTVINLLVTNPVLLVGIAVLAVGIVLMVWKQRRDRLYPKP